jgi:hypothetical protein
LSGCEGAWDVVERFRRAIVPTLCTNGAAETNEI